MALGFIAAGRARPDRFWLAAGVRVVLGALVLGGATLVGALLVALRR